MGAGIGPILADAPHRRAETAWPACVCARVGYNHRMAKRVLVAMSGGVDSSVAALLVQRAGHEVVGCTLNLWSYENRVEPHNECCSLEVLAVCRQLGVDHHLLDCGRDFKAAVVDPFVEDYLSGLTPSPCGHCNRLVRFPLLLEAMERLGCDALATGHHARIAPVDGRLRLLRGVDPFKDQAYFLYGLAPDDLARIQFPVGGMLKDEVWKIASAHGLVSARKPESQDLCFLPRGDYRAFLKANARRAIEPGEVVDTDGNVLGRHEGLPFYTVGQRRGLPVSRSARTYVVGLDAAANRLVVGDEDALYAEGLVADGVHWLGPAPAPGAPVEVKVRYRGATLPARWAPAGGGRIEVRFERPQRAVTPGQLAVLFSGDVLLGGGVIRAALGRVRATPVAAAG